MALPRITLGGVDVFKEWRASLAFLMGLSGSGRIKVDATPNGKRASLSHDGKRFVRLSGATNPYTATEVYPSASGGWDDAADSPTFTPVYDDWDQDGLDDKVVEIRPDAGEWRFLYKRIKLTTCNTTINVHVSECVPIGSPTTADIEDADIELIVDSVVVDSDVTDGSGNATVTANALSGTAATVRVTTPDGRVVEFPVTLSCATINLDYYFGECDLSEAPTTLYFSSPEGSCDLEYVGGGFEVWIGHVYYGGGPAGSWVDGVGSVCDVGNTARAWISLSCISGCVVVGISQEFYTSCPGSCLPLGAPYLRAPAGFEFQYSTKATHISGTTSPVALAGTFPTNFPTGGSSCPSAVPLTTFTIDE